ncbi:hypothetical protein G5714_008248 [Onychostoma macrolepis]|uniref:Uncharacterized protein n=1 Tax=Onychostoma macrolepis TaxID=369639 RepID=A0A7J6CV69_9TELE|nr:hypothetical protein G5714_008248 [Onychostoma macrolepis]
MCRQRSAEGCMAITQRPTSEEKSLAQDGAVNSLLFLRLRADGHSSVEHEANIFGHSADCHHNSLRLRCCSWLRLSFSLFVAPYVTTLPGDLWAIIKSCFQDAC